MTASILICGGGPAGMALALALERVGVASRIVEARPRDAAHHDGRILALSHGSRQALETLGVWHDLPHTPITTIHVSQAGAFGRTVLRAEEEEVPALGYVLSAGTLAAALDRALQRAGIEYRDNTPAPPADAAALVVHAEGRIEAAPDVITHDYGQHALICTASSAAPHRYGAWERFTPSGPLALLPYGAGYAVVMTCAAHESATLAALDDAAFLALLRRRLGERVALTQVSPRSAWPLVLRVRRHVVATRAVWIGNAAQTLHPVAGQGFNLALRDIMLLADTLADAADPGAADVLARYAARRRLDRYATIGFTDLLARLFLPTLPPLALARGAGLLLLDLVPPARSFLARRMMFGARAW